MKLKLVFLWHMHQPWYRGPEGAAAQLPWVRLHGLKDYLDMPLVAARYPELHFNFNLVPSLLEQIESAAQANVPDREFELSAKAADALSGEEKEFLIERAFCLPVKTGIQPHPHFFRLYQSAQNRGWRDWKLADWRDLQVWMNLAWVDPEFWSEPLISRLHKKGFSFNEPDKKELADWQKRHLARIIPVYRRLSEERRVELSTTPYYHPILPLLFDSDIATTSDPRSALPTPPFRFPVDAAKQLKLALESHEKRFGEKPAGVWPAEGAVSAATLELFASQGLTWTASDEEILFASLPQTPASDEEKLLALSTGYRFQSSTGSIGIVFRNRKLSDLIGFTYRDWEAEKAVEHFIAELHRLHRLLEAAGRLEPGVVSVILDGENAWEFYPADGRLFLENLYARLSDDPFVETIALKEYFTSVSNLPVLEKIWPGSWINKNFRIWIGHSEDNRAWSHLRDARRLWEKKKSVVSSQQAAEAYRHILIAEGSDWFWWYGDENKTPDQPVFDSLFRDNLSHAYQLLGEIPPEGLNLPIIGLLSSSTPPTGYVTPTIDGRESHFYEWAQAGCYSLTGGGAMAQSRPLDKIWYGYNREKLFFRIDFRSGFVPQAEDRFEIRFRNKKQELSFTLSLDGKVTSPAGENVPMEMAREKVLEFSLERTWLARNLEEKELYLSFGYQSGGHTYRYAEPEALRLVLDDRLEENNWQV